VLLEAGVGLVDTIFFGVVFRTVVPWLLANETFQQGLRNATDARYERNTTLPQEGYDRTSIEEL